MLLPSSTNEAEAAKHFLEEGSDQSSFHCPLSESADPGPHKISKCHIKQGPIKSSKKIKESEGLGMKSKDLKSKNGDE